MILGFLLVCVFLVLAVSYVIDCTTNILLPPPPAPPPPNPIYILPSLNRVRWLDEALYDTVSYTTMDKEVPVDSNGINAEFQLQYSPSKWVVNLPTSEAESNHVAVVTKASALVRETVPNELDLRYGPRESQRYDNYGTDLPKDSPIFVYVHGGYWQVLDKNESAYPAPPLYKAGIRCAIMGYDLAPNVTLEVIIDEIKEFATHILKKAKEDNCKSVWFGGHSAGAQMCASLLDPEWFNQLDAPLRAIFRGVILLSGIYDLAPLVYTNINDPLHLTRESALKLSPLCKEGCLIDVNQLQALIVVGQHDSPAFHQQSNAYHQFLQSKNIRTRLLEEKGKDHFSLVANLTCPSYNLTREIIGLIKNKLIYKN